ncbi:hypothetical protein LguiB_020441 [Lonicera macranthoides]
MFSQCRFAPKDEHEAHTQFALERVNSTGLLGLGKENYGRNTCLPSGCRRLESVHEIDGCVPHIPQSNVGSSDSKANLKLFQSNHMPEKRFTRTPDTDSGQIPPALKCSRPSMHSNHFRLGTLRFSSKGKEMLTGFSGVQGKNQSLGVEKVVRVDCGKRENEDMEVKCGEWKNSEHRSTRARAWACNKA